MRRRLTGAILLLYPRRVREAHGPEILALIDDLIAHEGSSRPRLFVRLAVDGLLQRIATTATAWTMVAVLAATSLASAPYNVPGDSATPEKLSMSLISAYPWRSPPARLVNTRTLRSDKRMRLRVRRSCWAASR